MRVERAAERPASPPTHTTSAVRTSRPTPTAPTPPELTSAQEALNTRLQDWRKDAATKSGLPSFFILSDTLLRRIAQSQPTSLDQLSSIHGIATEKIDRFGAAIVSLCQTAG